MAGSEGDELRAMATRALDLVTAVLALFLLSPLILVIAVAIKLDSPGPVLYRQLRIGLDQRDGRDRRKSNSSEDGSRGAEGSRENGSGPSSPEGRNRRDGWDRRTADLGGDPFLLYKFRTMTVGAEGDTGPVWATQKSGQEITRLGRFLRRHRLDEIPQFWNVLRGDMSVVGPRPERPSFVHRLRREIHAYQLRHRIKPGITGWAQVNRGYDTSVDDVRQKLRYDLEYLRRRSLGFDLRIMFATVFVMLGIESPFQDLGGARQ